MTALPRHAAIQTLFSKSVAMNDIKHSPTGMSHALWACDATRRSREKGEVDSKAEVDGS